MELKNKLIEIVKMLKVVPNINKETIIGIITPLETEVQANKMIEYLQSIDLSTTKQSPIIDEALYINDTF